MILNTFLKLIHKEALIEKTLFFIELTCFLFKRIHIDFYTVCTNYLVLF